MSPCGCIYWLQSRLNHLFISSTHRFRLKEENVKNQRNFCGNLYFSWDTKAFTHHLSKRQMRRGVFSDYEVIIYQRCAVFSTCGSHLLGKLWVCVPLKACKVSAAVEFLLPPVEGWWWWGVEQSVPTCRRDHAPGLVPAHTLVILIAVGISDLAFSLSLRYGSSQVPLPGISWAKRLRVIWNAWMWNEVSAVLYASARSWVASASRAVRVGVMMKRWQSGSPSETEKRNGWVKVGAFIFEFSVLFFCVCEVCIKFPNYFTSMEKSTGVLLSLALTESALPKLRQIAVVLSAARLTKRMLRIVWNVCSGFRVSSLTQRKAEIFFHTEFLSEFLAQC